MKRLALLLLIFVFSYLTYGLFINRYELNVTTAPLEPSHPKGYFDYKGVINVHTTLSSGSGTYESVIMEANSCDLDFLFFTDLNTFSPPKKYEGYHDKLLVFVGGEYSYLDSRILNLGATTTSHLLGPGRSQVIFADLLSKTNPDSNVGIMALAHPLKSGFQWQGSLPKNLHGLEVINLKEIWRNAWLNNTLSFMWTLLIYPFNPELAFIRLFEDPTKVLKYWDEQGQSRKLVGYVGADAEAKAKTPFGDLIKFPSYSVLFNIMRNHIILKSELTGNTKMDQQKIISALKDGQSYWSLDIMANPKGFLAHMSYPNSEENFLFGSSFPWKEGLELFVHLPQKPESPFEIIIYKDGDPFVISNSQDSLIKIHGPGTYRIVVRVIPTFPLPDGKKWIPWIYTNPFYVTQ